MLLLLTDAQHLHSCAIEQIILGSTCANLARTLPNHPPIRILLIEDDKDLANGIARSLEQSSFAVDVASDGLEGIASWRRIDYQLIILDLGLPDIDGIDVLKRLRRTVAAPVLILTARYDVEDRILGLNAGGDDYLAKPVELGELEARIRALLRRGAPISAVVEFADLTYEPTSRQVVANGVELDLTASEVAVLELLLRRQGKVVSKSQFLDALYDPAEEVNPSIVEVFVSRLRRKLEAAHSRVHIRALRGLGYRLEEGARV